MMDNVVASFTFGFFVKQMLSMQEILGYALLCTLRILNTLEHIIIILRANPKENDSPENRRKNFNFKGAQ